MLELENVTFCVCVCYWGLNSGPPRLVLYLLNHSSSFFFVYAYIKYLQDRVL
jgi:hypothetical protein